MPITASTVSSFSPHCHASRALRVVARWSINWRNFNEVNGVPWAPRAGHKLAVQCRYSIGANDTEYIDAKVKVRAWPALSSPSATLSLPRRSVGCM